MRLGCGPCAEEQAFLSRRKQVVAKALQQALHLDRDLREDEVWGLRGTRGLSQMLAPVVPSPDQHWCQACCASCI